MLFHVAASNQLDFRLIWVVSGASQWQILLSEVKRNKSPSFSAVQQITSGW